ncbi:hypothetical protein CRUP_001952 [Coryphaenoides rupestris]|nr:hypothetical protein CRUP_001952 [Coryphaenoides rupestris]
MSSKDNSAMGRLGKTRRNMQNRYSEHWTITRMGWWTSASTWQCIR